MLIPKERVATSVLFVVNGLVVGCWVPFIPERAHALGLSAGSLGATLLGAGLGCVVVMPLAGHLVPRVGSRLLGTVLGVGFALALLVSASMPTRWSLFAALVAFGACGAGMDIAMNAQAVLVESRLRQRILSSLHGFYSLGNVVGSLGSSAALARAVSPKLIAAVATGGLVVLVLACAPALMAEEQSSSDAPALRLLNPRLMLLGALVIAAMVCEGGTGDWSGLYLRNARGLGPGWAGVGFGVFATVMLLGRLAGDRIVTRLGEGRVLRLGGLLAALGATMIAFGPGVILLLFGFALFGIGLANASPILYRAAGRMPNLPAGVGLATSVGMGYAGLLAGPPLLGGVGQAFGLRSIFLVLAVLCLALSVGSAAARRT